MGKKRKGGERAIGAARILKYFFGFGLGGGRKGRVEHGVGSVRSGGWEGRRERALSRQDVESGKVARAGGDGQVRRVEEGCGYTTRGRYSRGDRD